ncbi:MAG: hypothetical protein H0V40_03490, partial [Actinobacteria bacterium]|nr:hypothetical protein [Actinomycetota bacterium]
MQGSRGALAGLAPAAVPASPAIDVAPPVTPNLVRARAIAGTGRVGRNALETLLFRGLSTPVALVLVVLQSRLLEPAGRGTFVLVVLSVTIGSRLLGQLGIAVTARLRAADVELRLLVHRAFALAVLVGLAACAPIVAWSVAAGDIGLELGLAAALALVPNILWQTVSGVLLGVSQLRLWNVIQLLPPVLTLVGMLVLVVGLDGGVRGAIAAWALAHLLTAAFA